ncbi:carbohydrate ABC transporter permease [Gracilibacillus oryzae]|uniref:Carbohydrate ABC transporter permease n=1 Tax=Gracilibacillus oryzae TaxID=1672701 RepID=A0A7C8GUE3_9BACI|nr:carbohydrate ABC transporter permease [Gracilibacillus oryzae]KAB8136772.1 carbohydrate ABC transporter permease [Gracilibacillus oryzae]
MFKKLSLRDKMFTIFIYSILIVVACLMLYPLIYVLSASFSNPERTVLGEVWLLPKEFNIESYLTVFQNEDVLIGYRNTIIYTVFGTAINILFTILIAYPLSRRDFYGKEVITGFIIFTMFFGGGMIPTYLLIKDLGMLDTIWAIVLPGAVSVYNVIIMRTFFQSIPDELREAASMDGCNNITLLVRIILPLSMPIIAVMALFHGVGHWNSYFDALIYLSDEDKFPLQLFLRQMLIQEDMSAMTSSGTDVLAEHLLQIEGLKYAVVVVASLPMLIIYPFLQKFFVKGVMIGSLKG